MIVKKLSIKTLAFLAAAVVFSAACHQEEAFEEKGNEVNFNVATGYQNGPATRTEYSGERYMVGSTSYERIDWVAGDVIRIASDKAATSDGASYADYTVQSASPESEKSIAGVSSSSPLTWGGGTNTFYGLYPAPGVDGVDSGVSFTDAGVATLVLPADQSSITMKYAYMGAATTASSGSSVSLSFKPLMNAYCFKLLGEGDLEMKLKSLTLSSDDCYLVAPSYTVTLNASDNSFGGVAYTEGTASKSITATFGSGAGVDLPTTGDPFIYTIFALPEDQSNLRLSLTFVKGTTEKTESFTLTGLNVQAGQKVNISSSNIDVPDSWEYTLSHTGTMVTLSDGTIVQEVVRAYDSAGATTTAPFDSYRTTDGGTTKEDVGVTYEYAEADADGLPARTGGDIVWSSAKPSTLSSVTASGSVAKTFSANVTTYSGIVKEISSEFLKHAENLKDNGVNGFTENAPQDLSLYDITDLDTPRTSGKPVTANCYVVDRAGWYMFPLVYGNAIDYSDAGSDGNARTLYQNGVNAYSYKDAVSPGDNDTFIWHDFQNFTGSSTSRISSPYVLDDCGGLTSSDVEAVVVWQDVESAAYSFIENVQVTDVVSSGVFFDPVSRSYKTSVPYIRFQVPMGSIDSDETKDPLQRVTGIRQGNAVIAVRLKRAKPIGGTTYSARTILWSWHIWITDGYDTDGDFMGDGLTPILVKDHDGHHSYMMPVNLGWCDTSSTTTYEDRVWYVRVSQVSASAEPIIFRVVQKKVPYTTVSSGTYYQWGRKDPFIPCKDSGDVNKAAYSPAGYALTGSTSAVSYNASPAANASTAIQNPYIHYCDDADYFKGWMSGSVRPRNLWNMAHITSEISNVAVYKTVYDPCPPGYSVPHRHAFTGFTTTGENSGTPSQWNVEDRNRDGSITSADFEMGWYFNTNTSVPQAPQTIYFPATSIRFYTSGALAQSGDIYCWSAAPYGLSAWYLGSDETCVLPIQHNYRSHAFPVRAIQIRHF